jgi:hypothetical protein
MGERIMSLLEATQFAIATHNGTITVNNPATGNHRTFRIRTQKQDAKFAPGERIVSLLTGPNNTEDFTAFGFVTDDGRIIVWRKHIGTQFERYARLLMNAEQEAVKFGLEFVWSAKCKKCNRELTDPESVSTGMGTTCRLLSKGLKS